MNDTPRVSLTILEKEITYLNVLAAEAFSGLFHKVRTNCNLFFETNHIINPLLTSFARSVGESIAFGFYRTDLAPSSLGLYEKPQTILSRTDLALG